MQALGVELEVVSDYRLLRQSRSSFGLELVSELETQLAGLD